MIFTLLRIYVPKEPDHSGTAIVVAVILIIVVIALFFSGVRDGFGLLREWFFEKRIVTYSAGTLQRAALFLGSFSYYQKLSPPAKREFLERTLNFLNTNSIEGAGDYEPDEATKFHIAATATQITFGFPEFVFSHFDTVILYPGIFKLSETGPLMKGATTPNGVIRISVRDYDAGYANSTDKLNVGLHEFGHALFMELIKEAQEEEENTVDSIHPYLAEADHILHSGKHEGTFLREYAFTNRHEFFAVSVEHFFEAPQEFSQKLPRLYQVMRDLLRQDPANVKGDYGFALRNV